MKRDGPKAPTAIHGPLRLKFIPLEKVNAIADSLENQLTPHNMCEENHKQQVEARVQALSEAMDDSPPEKLRPCDIQKLISSLKVGKACGTDGVPNKCLRHLSRRPLVRLTYLFNHFFRLFHFPSSWKGSKMTTLPKPGKNPKSPRKLRPISLLPTTGKLFEKVILKIVRTLKK
jgi:hypothetical protein